MTVPGLPLLGVAMYKSHVWYLELHNSVRRPGPGPRPLRGAVGPEFPASTPEHRPRAARPSGPGKSSHEPPPRPSPRDHRRVTALPRNAVYTKSGRFQIFRTQNRFPSNFFLHRDICTRKIAPRVVGGYMKRATVQRVPLGSIRKFRGSHGLSPHPRHLTVCLIGAGPGAGGALDPQRGPWGQSSISCPFLKADPWAGPSPSQI